MTTKPFSGNSRTLTNTVIKNKPSLFKTGSSKLLNNLEEIVDIEKDVEIYAHKQLNTISTAKLYQKGLFDFKTKLIKGISEQAVKIYS